MMGDHGDHDMTWMGVTMMVLVIVLIVSVVFLLVRFAATSSRAPVASPPLHPEEVLAHRLASGEITVEQYEQARDALRRGTAS
jgi:uncharacterized membrane protein